MQNFHDFILECIGEDKEICNISYTLYYKNYDECMKDGSSYFINNINDVLKKRKQNEFHFHNFLEHQLFSHLQEIKFYSTVDIKTTRRLVAVSQDCISLIQVLVRDKIHIIVHFRSSDFDGALPADYEFLSTIPFKLINHLYTLRNEVGYEECTEELFEELKIKEVQITISFGSLHRTV